MADCQLAIADGFGSARDVYLHTENFGCVVSISQCFEFVLTSDVDGNVACSGLVMENILFFSMVKFRFNIETAKSEW